MLVVTGQFDLATTLARIEQAFGPIPRPTRVLKPSEYTVEPPQEGARTDARRAPATAASSPCSTTWLPAPTGHRRADLPVLGPLRYAGRAAHRARWWTFTRPRQSSRFEGMKDPGLIVFAAGTSKDRPLDAVRPPCWPRWKGWPRGQSPRRNSTARACGSATADEQVLNNPAQYGVLLSEAIAEGDWRLFLLDRDRVEAATLADVQRVCRPYLRADQSHRRTVLPGDKPQLANVPTALDVAALVRDYAGRPAARRCRRSTRARPTSTPARSQTPPNGMQLALPVQAHARGTPSTAR